MTGLWFKKTTFSTKQELEIEYWPFLFFNGDKKQILIVYIFRAAMQNMKVLPFHFSFATLMDFRMLNV